MSDVLWRYELLMYAVRSMPYEGVRESHIQKGGKDATQLYRSGPNVAHVCIFITLGKYMS